MTTAKDALLLLNNQNTNMDGTSLAAALDRLNQPSFIDQKKMSIEAKLQSNREKFGITPPTEEFSQLDRSVMGNATGNTNLLDLAEASMYRAGGNLADAGRGISNKLFGTEFDDSEESGWSLGANADRQAGVSQEYRDNLSAGQNQVLLDIQNGNYGRAAINALKVAPGTVADSAATAAELGAGALLAPVGGLGAGILARRVKKGADALDAVRDRYKQVKEAAPLAARALDDIGKSTFITADIVQQQRNEYKAANGGEEPSAQRLAGMTLLTLVTTAWQPEIAKHIYMPKALKSKPSDAATQFIKDVDALMKRAEPGITRAVAGQVVRGIPKIAAAGGAEAVQEYAQTWAGILGTHMDPEEAGGLLQAAYNEFTDKDNRDETLQAAFLGGAAGGVTRAGQSAPGMVLGSAAEVAVGTQKAINRKVAEKASEAADKYISTDDKEQLLRENDTRKEEAKALYEKNKGLHTKLSNAKSLSDIENEPELVEMMSVMNQGKDLSDPDLFKSAVDSAKHRLVLDAKRALYDNKVDRLAIHTGQFAKEVGKEAKTQALKVAEKINITEEDIRKAVETTKEFAKKLPGVVIDELKNIPESTVYALALSAAEYSTKKSKETMAKIDALVAETSPEYIQDLAKAVEKTMPDSAAMLREKAETKIQAMKTKGIVKDTVMTSKTINPVIAKATQSGIKLSSNDLIALDNQLQEASKGKIGDVKAAKTVLKALDRYEESGRVGGLSEKQSAKLRKMAEKRIEDSKAELAKDLAKDAADYVIGDDPERREKAAEYAKKIKNSPKELSKFVKSTPGRLDKIISDAAKGKWKKRKFEWNNKSKETFLKIRHVLNETLKEAKDAEGVAEATEVAKETLTSEKALSSMAEGLVKSDNRAEDIVSMIIDIMPTLGSEEHIKDIREVVYKHLGEKIPEVRKNDKTYHQISELVNFEDGTRGKSTFNEYNEEHVRKVAEDLGIAHLMCNKKDTI